MKKRIAIILGGLLGIILCVGLSVWLIGGLDSASLPDGSTESSGDTPVTYEIAYNFGELEGDSEVNITSKTQTVEYGQNFALYTPTRIGYTFLYWTKEGETQPFTDSVYIWEENLTLIAKWEQEEYTIFYNLGILQYDIDVVIPSRKQTVTYGQSLSLYTPTRTGYTFSYWTVENETEPFTDTVYPFDEDVTLVAQWTKNPYTIIYHLGEFENDSNANISTKTQPVAYGDAFELAIPTYLGYDFVCWTVEGEDKPFKETKYYRTDNITLVASWKQSQYTITYHLGELENDSTVELSQKKQTYVHGEEITLATVSRPGYKFLYWKQSGESGAFTDTHYDDYTDIVLIAQWEKEVYTITYKLGELEGDKNVSIATKKQEVVYGESLTLLIPSHPDYRLEYWTIEGEVDKFDLTTYTLTEDIVLVAVWSNYTGWH